MKIQLQTIEAVLTEVGMPDDFIKVVSEKIWFALTIQQTDGQTKIDDEYICPKCNHGALGPVEATRRDGTTQMVLACNECDYTEYPI